MYIRKSMTRVQFWLDGARSKNIRAREEKINAVKNAQRSQLMRRNEVEANQKRTFCTAHTVRYEAVDGGGKNSLGYW